MKDNIEAWYRNAIKNFSELLPDQEVGIDLVYNDRDVNFFSRILSLGVCSMLSEEKKKDLASYIHDLKNKLDPRQQANISTEHNTMTLGDKVIYPSVNSPSAMNRAIANFYTPEQRFEHLFFHELGHFVDKEVFNFSANLFQNQPDSRAKDYLDNLCDNALTLAKEHLVEKNHPEDIHFALYFKILKQQAGEMYADCFSSVMSLRGGKFNNIEEICNPIIEGRLLSNEGLSIFAKKDLIMPPSYHNTSAALIELKTTHINTDDIHQIHQAISSIVEKTMINHLYQGSLLNSRFRDFLNSVQIDEPHAQSDLFKEKSVFGSNNLFEHISDSDKIKNHDKVFMYKLFEHKINHEGDDFLSYLHPDSSINTWVQEASTADIETFDELMCEKFNISGLALSDALNIKFEAEEIMGNQNFSLARACDRAMAIIEIPHVSVTPQLDDHKQLEIFERASDKSKITDIIKKGMNKFYYSPPTKIKYKN